MPVKRRSLLLFLLLCAILHSAAAQQSVVILDEADGAGDYRDASRGVVTPPDTLNLLQGEKLPLHFDHAAGGESSGVLEYRHTEGSWEMAVGQDGWPAVDLSGFDSLIVHLNGPTAIAGAELPRISLEDEDGGRTDPIWLSRPQNVRVDFDATGFTGESATDAEIIADYVDAMPSTERRPGYPQNLIVTFADAPLDTSVAGIGAPSTPVKFRIRTESGAHVRARFYDTNDDGTLSAAGEYIDALLPAEEGSSELIPTWRLTVAPATGEDPIAPPGEGDEFHLEVLSEEFALDGDPDSWQRIAIPMVELIDEAAYDPASFKSVVFTHGGMNPVLRRLWIDRITAEKNHDETFLEMIQRETFKYFWEEANPSNGLVKDRSTEMSPSSIAAVGFGLSAITVGIDREWISREAGRERVLNTLRFFWNAPQGEQPDATGHRGFFYHFLDMETGRRAWESELSTIDSALLLAGVLHMREYFDGSGDVEAEIRSLADSIYQRVDWEWMQFRHPTNPTAAISHGWRPESGFLAHDWIGYNEAMILYILALGSPTNPAGADAWDAWVSGYAGQWQTHYGYTFLTFPPLFGHQYSHVWIDFMDLPDAYMREKGIDYFENSRRATLAQRAYHMQNPGDYPNYSSDEWGLTASDTPTGYRARGAPPAQNDDGTLVPTAPGGSIVFTPEESIAALRTMFDRYVDDLWGPYGFRDAYNVDEDWFDDDYIGIDQGPILLMIENFRTEGIWNAMMEHDAIERGLLAAGFDGAALPAEDETPGRSFDLDVFPNPSTSTLHLAYTLAAPGQIEIGVYDVLGRRVAELDRAFRASGPQRAEVDVSRLASGTYFVVLEAPGGTLVHPISVLH